MLAWPELHRPALSTDLAIPTLHLFDSSSGKKKPVDMTRPFTMYVCGITPYDATHIGHAATYLSFDLIHRFLKAANVDVHFLENVTDIDDPLFERARRDGVDWHQLGSGQVRLFTSDMTNLRVLPPKELTAVTEAMPRIISFIEDLARKGLTYTVESDTYLDAAKVSDFTDLPLPMNEAVTIFAERGGDPDREGKRHPLDPLLWRASASGEPFWQSPFGLGRPGWHVECNAISSSLLSGTASQTLSLQGGGADLRFPHHYMTALQGRALTGSEFADFYVHAGMIRYQGEKMSKSLGNLVFVSRLIEAGIHPMAIRIALISGHYRQDREWSDKLLNEGEQLVDGLLRILSREWILPFNRLMDSIVSALANDLDTPLVCSLLRDEVERNDRALEGESQEMMRPGALARFLDAILGITL